VKLAHGTDVADLEVVDLEAQTSPLGGLQATGILGTTDAA
jgi:hypothetical protein